MSEVEPRWKQGAPKKKPNRLADKEWSKAVRERDQFRCQFPGCWVRDEHIDTHHIASRKQRPDLRHLVANGVSLCRRHHGLLHDGRIPDAESLGLVSHERYEKARNGGG